MDHLEYIKSKIRTNQTILIVGTGFSAATISEESRSISCATWIELIKNGIEEIRRKYGANKETWKNLQLQLLDSANSVSEIISVASAVQDELFAIDTIAYNNWIEETVGSLTAGNRSLGQAIKDLGVPIFTTNYDSLLEQTTGLSSATWKEIDKLHKLVKGEENYIGHLHGIFTDPDSIILSSKDYARLVNNNDFTFIEQLLYANYSFIYIGYGEGLNDPNFTRLIQENTRRFPNTLFHHYHLCLEKDLEALEIKHRDTNIYPMSYGKEYSDLPKFIRMLGESTSKRTATSPAQVRYILTQDIKESLTVDSFTNNETNLENIIIPPVLLPISEEQQIATGFDPTSTQKIQIEDISFDQNKILLVGSELSGLTTALKYLILTASSASAETYPVYIDADELTSRNTLLKLIRNKCVQLRIIDKIHDDLPPIALAVDNVRPAKFSRIENICRDLTQININFLIVGTRSNEQSETYREFSRNSFSFKSTYHLGKIGSQEIEKLTKLLSPQANTSLISKIVLEIASREHLSRTPFNISLLISLVLNAKTSEKQYKSETALLEDYVKLALDYFGSNQHVNLDVKNRETVLAEIALFLITEKKAAANESEIIHIIERTNTKYEWGATVRDIFSSFIEARMLKYDGNMVRFNQSAYLHLFGAKAAMQHDSFKDMMMKDLIIYSPVLRHYAALTRNSADLLEKIYHLLDEKFSGKTSGIIFSKEDRLVAPSEIGQQPDDRKDNKYQDNSTNPSMESSEISENDIYFPTDDTDIEPFPFDNISDYPEILILNHITEFASRALRDSDEILVDSPENIKNKLLLKILKSWGFLVDKFETDQMIIEFVNEIVDKMQEQDNRITNQQAEDMKKKAILHLPPFVVVSGMAKTLGSSKLRVAHLTLEKRYMEKDFSDEENSLVPSMIFLFSYILNTEKWPDLLLKINAEFENSWIINNIIFLFAVQDYTHSILRPEQERSVLEFLKANYINRHIFESPTHQSLSVNGFTRKLLNERMKNKTQIDHPLRAIDPLID